MVATSELVLMEYFVYDVKKVGPFTAYLGGRARRLGEVKGTRRGR